MKYTKEFLAPIVASSSTISEVLRKIGKRTDGATHSYMSSRIKKLEISTNHFHQGPHNKGKTSPQKLTALQYLQSTCIKSHVLKLKLIADGIKEKRCEICKNNRWMGQDIPLELDHIDGNHFNNKLENLRVICPNCHAQTPTHAGKNVRTCG